MWNACDVFFVPPKQEEQEMPATIQSEQNQRCIDACFTCAQMCEACADDMIGMKHHEDALMARCIRLCRDCTDICVLSARWLSRNSDQFQSICQFCAELCEQCAEVCERHVSHHALCGPCAEQCRHCAEVCREMAGNGSQVNS